MLRGSVFSSTLLSSSSSNLFGGAPQRLSARNKANARPPHQNRSGKPVQKLRCQQGDDDDDDRVRTISDALYVAFGTSATRVVQSLELLASGREYKRDHPTKGRQEAESFIVWSSSGPLARRPRRQVRVAGKVRKGVRNDPRRTHERAEQPRFGKSGELDLE